MVGKLASGAALALILSASSPTFGQTDVIGAISVDTTWDLAGSPYTLLGTISIRQDATLFIEPGVVVRIGPIHDIEVGRPQTSSGGTLSARGTEALPITFTSISGTTPGSWRQIRFTDFASDAVFDIDTQEYVSGSIMEWCIVEFAGAAGFNTGAVTVESSAPYFLNSVFRQNARPGVWAGLQNSNTLRIEGCGFLSNNHNSDGGGLRIRDGENHRIIDCEFRQNFASGNSAHGGGARIVSAPGSWVQQCTFDGNSATGPATRGGGLHLNSCPDSIIDGNVFRSNFTGLEGGGFYITSSDRTVISNNLISQNTARAGGGFYCGGALSVTADDNVVVGNMSTEFGGGVYVTGSNFFICEANLFQSNSSVKNGGGVFERNSNNCRYEGNTFRDNEAKWGGGLFLQGRDATLVGNTINCNTASTSGGGVYFTDSAIRARIEPPNSISSNVAGVDGGGIYNDAFGLDFSGTLEVFNRLLDNTADGRGDAIATFYPFNGGNGDVLAENTCWGTSDAIQIYALNWDHIDDPTLGEVRFEPFVADCVTDCNGNGENDAADICSDVSEDCNVNLIPDECDFASGVSQDCNGNGIPDECDIADGTSTDCNENLIPDECDIASDASQDCNSNALPDECDIASGFSVDNDLDGVPDECVNFEGDTDDLWSTAANWESNNVPGDEDAALVESPGILGGGTTVVLDIDVSVDSVLIRANSTLDMTDNGDLTIDAGNGITNLGTFIIGNGRSLIATASTTMRGSQPYIFEGPAATLSSSLPGNIWRNEATIAGEGVIDASIDNVGTVHANVFDGEFLVTGVGAKVNDGAFAATDGATLRILSTSISGTGQYVADNGTIVLDPDTDVASIAGGSMAIVNGGRFEAVGDAVLNLSGPLLIQSCGLFESVGSGAIATMGSVEVSEGVGGNAGTLLIGNMMSVSILDDLRLNGSAGQPEAGGQEAGGCSPPPVLRVDGDATVDIDGDFWMSGSVDVSVQLASGGGAMPFTLAGSFENFGVSAATFDWLEGPLRLDGTEMRAFEVAGEDRGASFNGYDGNFAIGAMTMAGTSDMTFGDIFDNMSNGQGACTEALYVRDLVLEAGAVLTLNNVRIYYETLVDDGATINVIGCGELVQVTCVGNVADANGDCDVDLEDFSAYVDCVTGDASAPGFEPPAAGCLVFDADGDGDVDLLDFTQLQTAFTGSN